MSRFCERVEDEGPEAVAGPELEAHLESCRECREQVEIDVLLRRSLGSLGGDGVPAGLEARTVDRFRAVRPSLDRGARRLLGTYWAFAVLVALFVVVSFDPPELGGIAAAALAAATGTSLIPVVLMLYRGIRGSRLGRRQAGA